MMMMMMMIIVSERSLPSLLNAQYFSIQHNTIPTYISFSFSSSPLPSHLISSHLNLISFLFSNSFILRREVTSHDGMNDRAVLVCRFPLTSLAILTEAGHSLWHCILRLMDKNFSRSVDSTVRSIERERDLHLLLLWLNHSPCYTSQDLLKVQEKRDSPLRRYDREWSKEISRQNESES